MPFSLQKSEAYAEDAFAKSQQATQIKDALEAQNTKFRKSQVTLQQELLVSNCACALMAGAIWALHSRLQTFSHMQRIMLNIVQLLSTLKVDMQQLCVTLKSEIIRNPGGDGDLSDDIENKKVHRHSGGGILRFRVIVISVIAVNRFFHISLCSRNIGRVPSDSNINSVYCGGVEDHKRIFRGKPRRIYLIRTPLYFKNSECMER